MIQFTFAFFFPRPTYELYFSNQINIVEQFDFLLSSIGLLQCTTGRVYCLGQQHFKIHEKEMLVLLIKNIYNQMFIFYSFFTSP